MKIRVILAFIGVWLSYKLVDIVDNISDLPMVVEFLVSMVLIYLVFNIYLKLKIINRTIPLSLGIVILGLFFFFTIILPMLYLI